jgi:hypothetical protein
MALSVDLWGRGKSRGDHLAGGRLRTLWLRWFLVYPRMCIAAGGYAVIAIFALGFGLASAIGVPIGTAVTVGLLAAGPVVVAVIGERVTGIKAFGVEVTLTEVTPPIAGDHTSVAAALSQSMGQGESDESFLGGSSVPDLSGPMRELIQTQSKLVRIDLRDDDYWWSTRIFLVAALAQDFTDVEALVFVRSGDDQIFVGISSPRDVRKRLGKNFSSRKYEAAYRKARGEAASGPKNPGSEIDRILLRWPGAVHETLENNEESIKQIVSSSALRRWMGGDLDTQSVPGGPLTKQKQYRIISHNRRYVALTNRQRLEEVVDRDELVIATQLDRKFGKGS